MTYLNTPFLAAQPGPHHGWRARFLLLLALVVMTLPAYGAPEKRVALVIGNTQYTKSPLDNPGNDARLIADTLASPELGFTKVIRHNNLDRASMIRAIKQFAVEARGAKVAFFYYSGHGIRGADGENYLQPIDKPGAAIETEDDVEIHAVPFNLVRAELGEENGRIALLMLDACRNNLTIKKRSDSNKDKGLKRDTAIGGMLIGYATQQGETAEDGSRGNSLFALSLASNLKKPGLEIVDVMRQVGADMKRQSGNLRKPQIPEIVIGSLFESYYLMGTPPPPGPATQLASLKPEPVNPTARPGQASGLSLDDLEKEETTRKEWATWQARMKTDYDKTAAFGGSADLRVKAWERFLGNYGQDNPLSREDEALRVHAQSSLAQAVSESNPDRKIDAKATFQATGYFKHLGSSIETSQRAILDEVATQALRMNLEVIIATGHAAVNEGSSGATQALSVRRAESVKAYLVGQGIEKNRVYTEGKGAEKPTKRGFTDDRRVELEGIGTKK